MAELYGVCSSAPPEAMRQALDRMRTALQTIRPGEPAGQAGPGFAIETLARHPLDPAQLRWDHERQLGWIWIGTPPDPAVVPDPATLVADLASKRFDRLWRSEPRFAACVVDAPARRLWLVSDRYGYQPVFYHWQDGRLAFATKLGALLDSGLFAWSWDVPGLLDLLTFEHVTGDRTLARDVRVQPPASVIEVADARLTLTSYRPAQYAPDGFQPARPPLPDADAADLMYRELLESVRRHLPPDRKVGITLSGGMDSRALLHCARELGVDVVAYTYGLPGCPDIRCASEVARQAGVPHVVVEVDGSHVPRWLDHGAQVTGGMLSALHYNILCMADAQLAEPRTILDGLAADGILGGNLRLSMVATRSVERAVDAVSRWRFSAWATPEQRASLLQPHLLHAAADYDPRQVIRRHFDGLPPQQIWRGCHRFEMLERWRRFTQYGPQMTQTLTDVRTPFWSNGFMDVAAQLSPWQLFDRRLYLALYARHIPGLGALPDSRRNLPLTRSFPLRFGKRLLDAAGRRLGRPSPPGLVDYSGWLRGPLGPWLQERLLEAPRAPWDLLRRDAVEQLVREHRAGDADHTKKLCTLLALFAWCGRLATTPTTSAAPDSTGHHPS